MSLEKQLDKILMEMVDERIKEAWDEIVLDAPFRTGDYQKQQHKSGKSHIQMDYISSIQVDEPTIDKGIITARVYTDLDSGWNGVPLGALLEWGTGPEGKASNDYQHGYPYTTDEPWNFIAQMQYEQTGTWGMMARPHFYPAKERTMARLKKDLEGLK